MITEFFALRNRDVKDAIPYGALVEWVQSVGFSRLRRTACGALTKWVKNHLSLSHLR